MNHFENTSCQPRNARTCGKWERKHRTGATERKPRPLCRESRRDQQRKTHAEVSRPVGAVRQQWSRRLWWRRGAPSAWCWMRVGWCVSGGGDAGSASTPPQGRRSSPSAGAEADTRGSNYKKKKPWDIAARRCCGCLTGFPLGPPWCSGSERACLLDFELACCSCVPLA
jgi:hypothetical protein